MRTWEQRHLGSSHSRGRLTGPAPAAGAGQAAPVTSHPLRGFVAVCSESRQSRGSWYARCVARPGTRRSTSFAATRTGSLSWAECNNQFHHHIPYTDPDAAQDIILGPSQGLVDRQDFLLCGAFHIEHSSFPHNVSIARHEMGWQTYIEKDSKFNLDSINYMLYGNIIVSQRTEAGSSQCHQHQAGSLWDPGAVILSRSAVDELEVRPQPQHSTSTTARNHTTQRPGDWLLWSTQW